MGKARILLIDDETGFTEMVKLNLEATGHFDVRIENDSTRALQAAVKYRPDLVILDVIMPEVEGPDVVFQLRNTEETKDIPIIFLTATVTREEVASDSGSIGGYAFLAKPSTLEELLACINKHLQRRPF